MSRQSEHMAFRTGNVFMSALCSVGISNESHEQWTTLTFYPWSHTETFNRFCTNSVNIISYIITNYPTGCKRYLKECSALHNSFEIFTYLDFWKRSGIDMYWILDIEYCSLGWQGLEESSEDRLQTEWLWTPENLSSRESAHLHTSRKEESSVIL